MLGLLLALWISLGTWICFAAPYGSGTDESIRYVAFVAATNRWASPQDATAFGIDHFYYPPLYYLLFAPFYGNEPAFTTAYPASVVDPLRFNGGRQLVPRDFLRQVPRELLQLYRTAKMVSLLFGVGIVACLVAALRLLFSGPNRDWLILGGTAPLLLLPQFLYYQTLVNNDCLVNFLCALALLFFINAARTTVLEGEAATRRWGILCAAAIGLGLLTKQSAVVLTPLLPALACLRVRSVVQPPGGGRRFVGALHHFLLLAGVCFLSGGWWLLRSALANDLVGLKVQQLAHPWAFEPHSFSWHFLGNLAGGVTRSYVALFAGELYGIPGWTFLLYLVFAATLGAAFVWAAIIRLIGRKPGNRPASLRRLVWIMLATTLSLNLGLIVLYNLEVIAPHGRLLFPSLLALHAFFALGLHLSVGNGRRPLAALVCVMIVYLGGLFLWTFRARMVTAVLQPDEHLVPLGINPGSEPYPLGPLWGKRLAQPLLLPPGRIAGLRLPISCTSYLPQFGTVVHARLRTFGTGSDSREYRFVPCSIADSDGSDGWTDLVLQTPVDLERPTPALLLLEARQPWFRFPGVEFGYQLIPLDVSPRLRPLAVDGRASALGLVLTAVYR